MPTAPTVHTTTLVNRFKNLNLLYRFIIKFTLAACNIIMCFHGSANVYHITYIPIHFHIVFDRQYKTFFVKFFCASVLYHFAILENTAWIVYFARSFNLSPYQ